MPSNLSASARGHKQDELDWDEEREELYLLLLPLVLEAAQQAAINGLDAAGLGGDVDLDLLFEDLRAFAEEYARALAEQITDTTRERVEAGLAAGMTLDELAVWFEDSRAEAIGISTITEVFAQGNMMAWLAVGLALHTWNTAGDNLVCPICRPNDGATVPIGFAFPSGHTRPTAHTRCRCWLSPAIAGG